jgi:type III restriction enzyme
VGASQEKAVSRQARAAVRSTRMVNSPHRKELRDVQRCHLNGAVFDSDREREVAESLWLGPGRCSRGKRQSPQVS